jgi:hypothetical protein
VRRVLRVCRCTQSAIVDRDLASLQTAIKMADDIAFVCPEVGRARELVARILEERRVLAELKKAIEVRLTDAQQRCGCVH